MSEEPGGTTETPAVGIPSQRYTAAVAQRIEAAWQDRWEREGTFAAPDPGEPGSEREKVYLLVMFPYPSGAGLLPAGLPWPHGPRAASRVAAPVDDQRPGAATPPARAARGVGCFPGPEHQR